MSLGLVLISADLLICGGADAASRVLACREQRRDLVANLFLGVDECSVSVLFIRSAPILLTFSLLDLDQSTTHGTTSRVAAFRFWPRWREVLVIVKPDTVIRWHRKGLRLYW